MGSGEARGTLHVVRQPSPWSLTASFGELTSFCRTSDARPGVKPGTTWALSLTARKSSSVGTLISRVARLTITATF